MIVCKKCGSGLNEYSRYCGVCGVALADVSDDMPTASGATLSAPENVRYCGMCGAKLPESCDCCLICGVKAGEAPKPEPTPELVLSRPQQPGPAVRRHSGRLTAVCVGFGFLLILSASAVWLYQNLPYLGPAVMSRAKDAIIYVTADGSLRYKTPAMEAPEEIIPGYSSKSNLFGSRLAKVGSGGRYIAYIDGYSGSDSSAHGRLYLRDFAKKPSLDQTEPQDLLLAENVTEEFFFTNSGSAIVFLNSKGELVSTDFSQSRLLDNDVSRVLSHSDNHVLYAKDTGDTTSVFLCSSIGSSETETVDTDVISLTDYTDELDKYIYLRQGPGGSRDVMARDMRQGLRRTMAVGVGDIIAADAESFTAMYMTESINPLRYDNLIDDALAVSDEDVVEPDLADYPMLAEFYGVHGEGEDLDEDMENYEELAEESERLLLAMEEYDAKYDRDKFRAQVRGDIDYFVSEHPTLYDLHLTTQDGFTAKLAGGSYAPFTGRAELDMESGFAVWSVSTLEILQKIPITAHDKVFAMTTPFEYLSESLGDEICFQRLGSATVSLDIGDGRFHAGGWRLTENGGGIYFAMSRSPLTDGSEDTYSLYYAPITDAAAGSITMIDERVSGVGPVLQGDKLLYYKDSFEDACTLYMAYGGVSERIGDSVSLLEGYFNVENDAKTILYYEHFDNASKSGNLFMISKQNRQLATDAYRAFYRSDSLVYFLRGLKNGGAELYSFSDEGLLLIDERVSAVME